MSSPPRPRQVTFTAGLIIGGSVLLVFSVFESISGLRSLATREAVEEFLAEPPGNGMGLSVENVLTMLRVASMVAAACAVAMAILGIQIFKRSHSARIALSVLAVPLMVTGLTTGGVLAPVVTVAVVMLWMQPARDWFAGIEPRPAPEQASRPEPPAWRQDPPSEVPPTVPPSAPPAASGPGRPSPPGSVPESVPGSGEPRPYAGFGTTAPQPAGTSPYGVPQASPADRPGAVLWACVLTWTLSGLVALGMLASAVVIALSPDLIMDELRRQEPSLAADLSEDLLVATTVAMAVVLVVWCAAAIVFAWFAFRRARWAQVTLLVSAGIAGAVCLLATLAGSFPLLLILAGCGVTFSLLLRPEVRAWYASRGTI